MKICVLSLALAVIAASACSTDTLSVKGEFFGVTSHGDSTMLYTMTRPVKELKAFRKVRVKAGETVEVSFEITPEMLSWYEVDQYNMTGNSKPLSAKLVLEPGDFNIMTGPNSRDTQSATLTVK